MAWHRCFGLCFLAAYAMLQTSAAQQPAAAGFADKPWGYHPVQASLTVEGTIPSWVQGDLFRNGPGRFAYGGKTRNESHWFGGLALLHRFHIADGTVSYTSEFVKSSVYNESDPCAVTFRDVRVNGQTPTFAPNTDVTIRKVDGVLLSNGATTASNGFDSALDTTQAPFRFADNMTDMPAPSHAHTDLDGTVIHFAYDFQNRNYRVYQIPNGTRTRHDVARITPNPYVGVPMYQHSFGLTENYVVMSEIPVTFPQGGFDWKRFGWFPQLGVTWRVVHRVSGRELNFTSPAFSMYHHVNAYESGDDIVVDLVTYPDNKILTDLYLEVLLDNPGATMAAMKETRVTRFKLPLQQPGATVVGTVLADVPIELPTIHYDKVNTRHYEFAYGVSASDKATFFDRLVKIGVESGTVAIWNSTGMYPSEPVFVPSPSQESEDDGVLLSVVLDSITNSSFLLVLNATTMQEEARASVDQVVPHGFHGRFFD